MTSFPPTPQPTDSPWGRVHFATEIVPGIWEVGTASHGGLLLSPERQAAMPDALRLGTPTYEEDTDWTLAVLAFEAEIAATTRPAVTTLVALAHDIARNWHPARYGRFTNAEIVPRDTYILRQRAARIAAIGKAVVTSAFGDWADWVPAGQVGLVARTLEAVDALGRMQFAGAPVRALVPADRYQAGEAVNTLDALAAVPVG